MKKSLSVGILSLLLLSIIASCKKDEIPEEFTIVDGGGDSTRVNTQIEILNQAGEFYNFNLKVLDGSEPISGATVTLTSGENGSISEVEATSDAEGNVVFQSIIVGGNIITITAEGYYPISGIVNFRFEEGYNYEIVENEVIPIERNESMIVPLFGIEMGNSLATIKGNVTIETDLTNQGREIPEGTTIRANFNINSGVLASEGLSLRQLTLAAQTGLGEGTVQADGSYEIRVPVAADGGLISLIVPEIRIDQRLAINGRRDDDTFEGPQIVNIPASYTIGRFPSQVPFVSGVKVQFTAPPIAGTGLQINNFERVGRELFEDRFFRSDLIPSELVQSDNGIDFLLTAGSNFQGTPSLDVTGGSGTGFSSSVELRFAIASLTIENQGQYGAGESVSASFEAINDGQIVENFFIDQLFLSANADGFVTQEVIDDVIQNVIDRGFRNRGFGDNFVTLFSEFDEIRVVFSNSFASASPETASASVRINSSINRVRIIDAGENYLDPVFTFSGGTPEVNATLDVQVFPTRWRFDLDNSQNSSPYIALPNISFEYLDGSSFRTSSRVINLNTGLENSLANFLTTNESGEVIFSSVDFDVVTDFSSVDTPSVIIVDPVSTVPSASVSVDDEGRIVFLNVERTGSGYVERFNAEILPSIDGLPGSGAEIRIVGGNFVNGVYSWFGEFRIDNGGSGYLRSVNTVNQPVNDINNINDVFLVPGETIYRDIDYGSGRSSIVVF